MQAEFNKVDLQLISIHMVEIFLLITSNCSTSFLVHAVDNT